MQQLFLLIRIYNSVTSLATIGPCPNGEQLKERLVPNSQQQADRDFTVRRSELACPASSAEKMAKAAAGEADEVIFDLEDGCAPSQKIAARKTLIEAFHKLDFRGKVRAFRPNGLHTSLFYRDVIEVVEAAGARIDAIILPKIDEASDVLFADRLLTQIEQHVGLLVGGIKLEVVIETPKAVLHAEQIAASTPRMAALIFGVLDYAGAIGARGQLKEQFALYHYPKARVLAAARAAGIDAIDSVTLQFRDLELCERDARSAAEMGFDGKWTIHPDQVKIVNRVFTPSEQELVRARELLKMYEKADTGGAGVFVYHDEMIDAASLHIERKKLAIAKKTGSA
jgi:citrate lyase subunit beta / citryl-CoA lyase